MRWVGENQGWSVRNATCHHHNLPYDREYVSSVLKVADTSYPGQQQASWQMTISFTCSKGSSGGSRALRAMARVALLGRSMLRDSSTACHSISVRLREAPISPVTCRRHRPGVHSLGAPHLPVLASSILSLVILRRQCPLMSIYLHDYCSPVACRCLYNRGCCACGTTEACVRGAALCPAGQRLCVDQLRQGSQQ